MISKIENEDAHPAPENGDGVMWVKPRDTVEAIAGNVGEHAGTLLNPATTATARRPRKLQSHLELWTAFKANPTEAQRNELIEIYLSIVRYQAERVWAKLPDGVELDDLVSSGVFGLMDAIDSFDLKRGVKFETYCVPRIRGAMLDELRVLDWVPRLVRQKQSRIREAKEKILERGEQVNDESLCMELGIAETELQKLLAEGEATTVTSLNKKWYETDSDKDVTEGDMREDAKAVNPTNRLEKGDKLRAVTKGLNRNERLIIILYYYEQQTMKQIGATLGLSESRVSQMHSSLMQRLGADPRLRAELAVA